MKPSMEINQQPTLESVDAFNGTNSFTGSTSLYNMDLDVYTIQNNINIGDTSAQIQLTSGQDFVMINAIVTKLNSQLPMLHSALTILLYYVTLEKSLLIIVFIIQIAPLCPCCNTNCNICKWTINRHYRP
jgi:hypothetical protein